MVKVVANTPGTRLIVNGTGKGRWAMPAVKLARALGLGERVAWNGNDNDSTVMKAGPDTIILVPEPERPYQQVVMASYMLAGAIVAARDNVAARALVTNDTDGLLIPAFTPDMLSRIVNIPADTRQALRLIGNPSCRHPHPSPLHRHPLAPLPVTLISPSKALQPTNNIN